MERVFLIVVSYFVLKKMDGFEFRQGLQQCIGKFDAFVLKLKIFHTVNKLKSLCERSIKSSSRFVREYEEQERFEDDFVYLVVGEDNFILVT